MMRLGHAAIVQVAILAAMLPGCSDEEPKQASQVQTPRSVSTTLVEKRALGGRLTVAGLLAAREEAAVGSELSGFRILRVMVEEGDVVRRGQALAQLDATLLQHQVDQLAANLAQQRVLARQEASQAGRVAGLDDQGVLAEEEIEARRLEAESARAAAASAEAQWQDARAQLSRLTIRSPVAGRVLERTAAPGQVAASGGDPLFRIARDGLIELDVELSEQELPLIKRGASASVTLPSGERVAGEVRLVDPKVDPETNLGHARIALPRGTELPSGGFAEASFQDPSMQTPVLVVSEKAIRFDADGVSVMVVGADNKVQRVAVKTGRRADSEVELLEGPPAGSRVLLGSSAFVLEGDLVQPQAAPAASGSGQKAPAPARPAAADKTPDRKAKS